ncbi:MAG: lipopolysaccharide heptosyltransferase II [Planctomycetales bacterium]
MPKRISLEDLPRIDARNVCVIKPSALGDVVQALPLLPALRARFPRAQVAWVIHSGFADLLRGHPWLDDVIPFRRHGRVRETWALFRELRQRRFDLVLDLQGLLRTAGMALATGAPTRIGLQTARELAFLSATVTLPDTGKHVPAHERYWRVAEALGVGELRRETIVAVGDEDRQWVRRQAESLSRPMLAVLPGARWRTKRWPIEKFAAVTAKAMRHLGYGALLLGSADERPLVGQLADLLRKLQPSGKAINLAGRTTLKQLAAVLSEADAALTNDSGPMHLAAGLGTPVVSVFTCTNPARSGPPGDVHELVATTISCAGSYRRRCPHRGQKHLACLDEIEVERVWQALVRVVERTRSRIDAA